VIIDEFQHFGVEIIFIDQALKGGPVDKPLRYRGARRLIVKGGQTA